MFGVWYFVFGEKIKTESRKHENLKTRSYTWFFGVFLFFVVSLFRVFVIGLQYPVFQRLYLVLSVKLGFSCLCSAGSEEISSVYTNHKDKTRNTKHKTLFFIKPFPLVIDQFKQYAIHFIGVDKGKLAITKGTGTTNEWI